MPESNLPPHSSSESRSFTCEFPEIKIRVAQYEEGPTACTIFVFPERVTETIDIRGGEIVPGINKPSTGYILVASEFDV